MCHSGKKKAQWYILAPTAKRLPERQAAGLEQSHGRNAISLRKKKVTAHLPILTAQGKQAAQQNKAASVRFEISGMQSSGEALPIIVQNPYLYVHPEVWPSPEFCCKKEKILTVFL